MDLLDVASGLGTSAIYLAETTGCRVVGLDISSVNVALAEGVAMEMGLEHHVRFRTGDAEQVPFADKTFDAVLCECAFCTFPSKATAAREMARVLRSGGRVAISDLTRRGAVPRELDTLLGWVGCLADARPIEEYRAILLAAGLRPIIAENHDGALRDLARSIRLKLLAAEAMIRLGKLDLPIEELRRAKDMAKAAARAIDAGAIGYEVLVAGRPE
jgi:ubiquinone/menaquinone biosynthesis C-methylase UbiE